MDGEMIERDSSFKGRIEGLKTRAKAKAEEVKVGTARLKASLLSGQKPPTKEEIALIREYASPLIPREVSREDYEKWEKANKLLKKKEDFFRAAASIAVARAGLSPKSKLKTVGRALFIVGGLGALAGACRPIAAEVVEAEELPSEAQTVVASTAEAREIAAALGDQEALAEEARESEDQLGIPNGLAQAEGGRPGSSSSEQSSGLANENLSPIERERFQFELPPNHGLIEIPRGSTLSSVARTFGTTVDELVNLNGIQNPDFILNGDLLLVPILGDPEGSGIDLVDSSRLKERDELFFVVSRRFITRPDLMEEIDFSDEELREINYFARETGPDFLARLYGPPAWKGLVWIRRASPGQEESFTNIFGISCGGFTQRLCASGETPHENVCNARGLPIYLLNPRNCEPEDGRLIYGKWQEVLIEEMAHVWLSGVQLPPFDDHRIVHLAVMEMAKSRGIPPEGIFGSGSLDWPEYLVLLRDPTFYRRLISHFVSEDNLTPSEEEVFEVAEEIMPGFRNFWEEYSSPAS